MFVKGLIVVIIVGAVGMFFLVGWLQDRASDYYARKLKYMNRGKK